jgi:hydrogenase expression/formation protein HypC
MNVYTDFLSGLTIGDYLVVHAGYALEKLKPDTAIETINILKEIQEIEKS